MSDPEQKERRRRNLLAKRMKENRLYHQKVVEPKPSKEKDKRPTKKDILREINFYWREDYL